MVEHLITIIQWFNQKTPPFNLEFYDRYLRPFIEDSKTLTVLRDVYGNELPHEELLELQASFRQFEHDINWKSVGYETGKRLETPMFNDNEEDATYNTRFRIGYHKGLLEASPGINTKVVMSAEGHAGFLDGKILIERPPLIFDGNLFVRTYDATDKQKEKYSNGRFEGIKIYHPNIFQELVHPSKRAI